MSLFAVPIDLAMTIQTQRPVSLKVIVAYKGIGVLVLAVVSLVSAFSWRNYEGLLAIAQDYLLDEDFTLTDWFLTTVLNFEPHNLRLISFGTGGYAVILGTATTGFWYGKRWARVLMLLMAGLPLPVEVYELLNHASWERVIIFLINLGVIGYLFKHIFDPLPTAVGSLKQSA